MDIEYIKTPDINMASTLHTLGFPIDGIHAKEGKEYVFDFYFVKSSNLIKAIDDYTNKKLLVEPQTLLNSRREIMRRMHDESKSN